MSYGILTPNGLSYEKAYYRDETFRKLKNYKPCIRNYVIQDGANSGWMMTNWERRIQLCIIDEVMSLLSECCNLMAFHDIGTWEDKGNHIKLNR